MTDLGKQEIQNLQESMTKNHELEDNALELILGSRLNDAYRLICQWEAGKNGSRGIGMDWNKEYERGLPQGQLELYQRFLDAPVENIRTTEDFESFAPQIKGSVILGKMMGHGCNTVVLLVMRITGIRVNRKAQLISLLNTLEIDLYNGHV